MTENRPENDESGNIGESNRTGTGSVTRHVGPTLESEGIFQDVEDRALNTGEAGRDADLADALEVRTIGEDQAYQQLSRQEDEQRVQGIDSGGTADIRASAGDDSFFGISKKLGQTPEPLKTRLEGDTSSDPHTDLGPDNATTVQARQEGNQTHDSKNNR